MLTSCLAFYERRVSSASKSVTRVNTYCVNLCERVGENGDQDWINGESGHADDDNRIGVLVSKRVFDSAANMVMRIGPNIGWKLDACAKLRYVLPNQICTMSQVIALKLHAFSASVRGQQEYHDNNKSKIGLPRLCSVKSNPEKHIAAIPTKKMKSAIIARRALFGDKCQD